MHILISIDQYSISSSLVNYTFSIHIIIFSFFTPEFLNNSVHAWADAPAPLTTTLISFIDLPLISNAFISAAVVIIAVPCWSSWKTGISKISFNFCSIIKQSGAAISSKFIPPNVGAKFLIEFQFHLYHYNLFQDQ